MSQTPLAANPPRFLAIEIGGSKLQVCAGTADGEIVERRRFAIKSARGAEGIRAQIVEAVHGLVPTHRPRAIGVGYGGPVDWRTGRIVRSHHIAGWDGFGLAKWLCEISGVPAFVENDGNVAALGEARFGAGRGANPVFYVTVGSGVGGGLVADGRIYHGVAPGEAEVGHLRVDDRGRTTEECCSGWSLNRRVQEAAEAEPGGALALQIQASPGHEARHLAPALAAGDPAARQILEDATAMLARALSHAAHLFHPEVIVLGGGVSLLGEVFREAVARQLRPLLMEVFLPGPRVVLAALREDAVPAGALALAASMAESETLP